MATGRAGRAWQVAFVLAFVAATYLLLAPGDRVEKVQPLAFWNADKIEHAATFALLAFLAARAYPRNPTWGVFVALVLYGIAIEVAQRNVPGRSSDALDAIADAVGALVAFLPRPLRRDAR